MSPLFPTPPLSVPSSLLSLFIYHTNKQINSHGCADDRPRRRKATLIIEGNNTGLFFLHVSLPLIPHFTELPVFRMDVLEIEVKLFQRAAVVDQGSAFNCEFLFSSFKSSHPLQTIR